MTGRSGLHSHCTAWGEEGSAQQAHPRASAVRCKLWGVVEGGLVFLVRRAMLPRCVAAGPVGGACRHCALPPRSWGTLGRGSRPGIRRCWPSLARVLVWPPRRSAAAACCRSPRALCPEEVGSWHVGDLLRFRQRRQSRPASHAAGPCRQRHLGWNGAALLLLQGMLSRGTHGVHLPT